MSAPANDPPRLKWKRAESQYLATCEAGQTWRVWRSGSRWIYYIDGVKQAEKFRTLKAAQRHCEARAATRPVQRWFNGEPLSQLPEGTADKVLDVARRHAFIATQLPAALETIHRQVVNTHNTLMDGEVSDERMKYLRLGAAHGFTTTGEAVAALRDWVVGRLG